MLTAPHFTPKFPTAQWTLPAVLEHQAVALAELDGLNMIMHRITHMCIYIGYT